MPRGLTSKQVLARINHCFIYIDTVLSCLCLLLFFISIPNQCFMSTMSLYLIFFSIQTLQHTLIHKFPHIDINKHYVAFRRIVTCICVSDLAYLMMVVTFWERNQNHPLYCVLCVQFGLSAWTGVLFVMHLVFVIGWAVTLVEAYINRRYYLLGLGGFEVEQRIMEERQRQLNMMNLIEPDTSPYAYSEPSQNKNKDKYYQFQDVVDQGETKYQCSICLNKQVEDDHFVNAGCGHYFHQICLVQWVKINSNCPQCRHVVEPVSEKSSKEKYLPHIEEEQQQEHDDDEPQQQGYAQVGGMERGAAEAKSGPSTAP